MMRTLITGADGFSASHLLPLLRAEGKEAIFGASLAPSPGDRWLDRTFVGDILEKDFLRETIREARPDRVYHLAAIVPVTLVRNDFPRALRVNVEGTQRLLDALSEEAPEAKVLIVGSSDEYGARPREEMPLRELDTFSPANGYGVTKVAQELLARLYQRERGMPVVFARTFNFTGPGQPADYVCSSFARQVERCRQAGGGTIRVGNIDVERDFLDIRDVVGAYRALMEKGTPGQVYNVCSGEVVSLRRILEILRNIAGVGIAVERDEARVRKVDIPYLVGDNSRLRGLGWKRKFPIGETLADLLRSLEGIAV
ncbi:MAG: GDP-mannose 4,6-dehydratase [Deltaproteobacteria bacterium]|nr:GDP-mannose 4,6-dehydratase [Deltaproteobacteria bacterium]